MMYLLRIEVVFIFDGMIRNFPDSRNNPKCTQIEEISACDKCQEVIQRMNIFLQQWENIYLVVNLHILTLFGGVVRWKQIILGDDIPKNTIGENT